MLKVLVLGTIYCWIITASSVEGMRRLSIQDTDAGCQVKGKKKKICLFSNRQTLYPLSGPMKFDLLTLHVHPSLVRQDQEL